MNMRQLLTTIFILALGGAANFAHAADEGELLFVRRIAPLLEQKCISCHGAAVAVEPEGGLSLRSRAQLLTGGASGVPLVDAEHPNRSPLLSAVERKSDEWSAMPPKESERLSVEEIAWLRRWLQLGSPWVDDAKRADIVAEYSARWESEDGILVPTSGGLSLQWNRRKYQPTGLWAYAPLNSRSLKTATTSSENVIDRAVENRMPANLRPTSRADRATWIRRATLDLTGLPPTIDEVVSFVNDTRTDREAAAALVDRLLESPHYGEQMTQHWLDVTRYADSSGFSNDYERGNAWRYRDYVVRAFNADKPYDQFVREQIAGDEILPNDPEGRIAVGFLRMGPWELTGMEVAKVARQRFLDDVTNSVGEVFLAHSLQCARCHDHKFDPIPTRDYYAIQAVFATTQCAERSADFLAQENRAGFDEQKTIESRREEHLAALRELDDILLNNADQWFVESKKSREQWDAALEKIKGQKNRRGLFDAARALLLKEGAAEEDFPPKLVGFTPQQFGLERVARKGLERLEWELDRYQPIAFSVYNGATPDVKSVNAPKRMPADSMKGGEIEETCILAGGDPFSPTESVRPGALSVLSETLPMDFTNEVVGRRTALAQWITDPRNPLTARVMVNRLWQQHFNRPLAGNPNNFGSTGKPPTHPELLDWLAEEFIRSGWSIKHMHRIMMNSDAYARVSEHPDPQALDKLDPDGISYARFTPRRLTAEEIRDSLLCASGDLNRTLGGIPVRPEINQEAALQPRQVMGTFAAAWVPNPRPQDRHRRTLYTLKLRGLTDPLLEVFNAPSPDFSSERREASTVSPQAFALLNSHEANVRSLSTAVKAHSAADSDEAAIRNCFRMIWTREPSPDELRRSLKTVQEIETLLPEQAEPLPRPPLKVVRRAVEENTGEQFTFEETLHGAEAFAPDLDASQLTRRQRALAELCLVLFNSHEFIYVY